MKIASLVISLVLLLPMIAKGATASAIHTPAVDATPMPIPACPKPLSGDEGMQCAFRQNTAIKANAICNAKGLGFAENVRFGLIEGIGIDPQGIIRCEKGYLYAHWETK
jgi:hypothetical protein